MKTCSKCSVTRSLSEFHKDKDRPSGYVSQCKPCRNEHRRKLAELNYEHELARGKKYREENAESMRAYRQSEVGRQKRNAWFRSPKGKAYRALKHARDPSVGREHRARRRARLLLAEPAWSQRSLIRQFYKDCPKGFEVDHIVPLSGANVCGLHVLENLQYLPMSKNRSKGWQGDEFEPFGSCALEVTT